MRAVIRRSILRASRWRASTSWGVGGRTTARLPRERSASRAWAEAATSLFILSGKRSRPPGHADQARRRLTRDTVFPLERLEGSLASWSDPAAIQRAYAQSLVLVDHIAAQYGDEALRAMVRGCADGVAVGESFERASSVPLAFVVDDLPNYLR